MGIFQHWSLGSLFLIALELFLCFHESAATQKKAAITHQRCFGDLFVAPNSIATLARSNCVACDKRISIGVSDPHAHILFILPPWSQVIDSSDSLHPLVSLAAIMYRRGFDVTVYQLRDATCRFRRDNLPAMIFSNLPCDGRIRPNNTVSHYIDKVYNLGLCKHAKNKNLADNTLEGPYDGLQNVPIMIKTLKDLIPRVKHPHALVVDSTHVAAVLQAERMGIPVIVLAEPTEVDLITERTPIWRGLYDYFGTLIRTMQTGTRLSRMNMIRKSLGLPLYKLPSDYYTKSATSVLIHPDFNLSRELPYNAEAIRPLVTECVTCNTPTNAQTTVNNVTVLVTPLEIDFLTMRNVLRAIAVAKTTLQEQADIHCSQQMDSWHCQHLTLVSQMTAVVLKNNGQVNIIPDMLPPYVQLEKIHPVDSLARNPFTYAVISHCLTNSHVPAGLGLPLICIPRHGELRNIAYDGKKLGPFTSPSVRDLSDELVERLMSWNGTSGMGKNFVASKNSAAEILARVSYLSKMRNISETTEEERRLFLGQPQVKPEEPPSETFEFLRTWLMSGISFVFVIVGYYSHLFLSTVQQESQIAVWRRRYRWLAPYTNDIDTALFHYSTWLSSPDALHNNLNQGKWKQEADHEHSKHRNGSAHHSRRKKSVKKR